MRKQSQWHKTQDEVRLLDRLVGINLLEGLLAGPAFSKPDLNLPTSRNGTQSLKELSSLPPALVKTPVRPSPSRMIAVRMPHTTPCKSYRKTLQPASGFCAVFVSYVPLPETDGTGTNSTTKRTKSGERQAAKSGPLSCVGIENMGSNARFLVKKVDVTIGGGGLAGERIRLHMSTIETDAALKQKEDRSFTLRGWATRKCCGARTGREVQEQDGECRGRGRLHGRHRGAQTRAAGKRGRREGLETTRAGRWETGRESGESALKSGVLKNKELPIRVMGAQNCPLSFPCSSHTARQVSSSALCYVL